MVLGGDGHLHSIPSIAEGQSRYFCRQFHTFKPFSRWGNHQLGATLVAPGLLPPTVEPWGILLHTLKDKVGGNLCLISQAQ